MDNDTKGENMWIVNMDTEFSNWNIRFPQNADNRLEMVMEFIQQLTHLSYRYHILKIKSLPELAYDFSDSNDTLANYFRSVAESTQIIPLHLLTDFESDTHSELVTTRLSYFNLDGEIIEDDVSELGKVLFNNSHIKPRWENYQSKLAIDIFAHDLPLFEEDIEKLLDGWKTTIQLSLYSNIWFPIIPIEHDLKTRAMMITDNKPLAQRHTLRLNNFLKDLKQVALDVGAEWYLDLNGVPSFYHNMLTETGNKIDS